MTSKLMQRYSCVCDDGGRQNRAKLAGLWADNRRLWCHIANSLTGDPLASDDIVQTAFAKGLSVETPFVSERHSLNYFRKIVIHCACDYANDRRKKEYRLCHLRVDPRGDYADPESLVLDRESEAQRSRVLQAVVSLWPMLPKKQSDVLHYVLLHGISLRQYSQRRGLPLSTARSRLVRGLDLLRRLLRRHGGM